MGKTFRKLKLSLSLNLKAYAVIEVGSPRNVRYSLHHPSLAKALRSLRPSSSSLISLIPRDEKFNKLESWGRFLQLPSGSSIGSRDCFHRIQILNFTENLQQYFRELPKEKIHWRQVQKGSGDNSERVRWSRYQQQDRI